MREKMVSECNGTGRTSPLCVLLRAQLELLYCRDVGQLPCEGFGRIDVFNLYARVILDVFRKHAIGRGICKEYVNRVVAKRL